MNTDILIIGTGVAATTLVTKILKEKPDASITMLEAGNKLKMKDFSLFQNFMITNKLPSDSRTIYDSFSDLPYPDRDKKGENNFVGDTPIPLNGARLIMYGGSTVHWGGWAFRLKPEDFKLADNSDIKDSNIINWAIDYNELERFYCEAEHYLGVSGNSKDITTPRTRDYLYREFPFTIEDGLFIEAFEKGETKINYSNLPIARYGIPNSNSSHSPCQTTGLCKYCPFGARYNACNSLDDFIEKNENKNLKVITNVVAEEILMDSRKTAKGVRFYNKVNNKREIIEANLIVIASGAIEAPKILQRSKSEFWKNGIGNDFDLVGRNLISHPYFFFKATLPENKEMLQPEMGFPTLVSRHFDSIEEQSKGKFILINPPSSPKADLTDLMKKGKSKSEIENSIKANVTVQMQGIIEVFSNKNNMVQNSDRQNRFGMTETKITFSKDSTFDNRMKEVQNIVSKIFGYMGANTVLEENPISWRADHAACTTRMSDSPEKGVVDKNLKIHEVENLFVCSNSSFASLGAVNPTLTLTALSFRLAEHIITTHSF